MHGEQEVDERVGKIISHVGYILEVHLWQIFSPRLSNVHPQLKVQFQLDI